MLDSCECGNEPPSFIKCGKCSMFPSWSAKDLSAPLIYTGLFEMIVGV